MTFETGARLDSHELVTLIGRGGMGEVWLARDTRLGRTVALKLLPPDLTADEARRARFQREARAASGLNHPNICTIYSLGDAGDGRLYLTMEFVGGDTLRQRLSHQALTLVDALAISSAIGSALCTAHAEHIVHRDIKPENVMIRGDGLVKVLDFGLAKLMAPAEETLESLERTTEFGEHRTHPGTVLGTPAYMSPEQARGDAVDHRTDIWSLGIVTFEMVAGLVPFRGRSSSDVLAAILVREPAPLARFEPDVPTELQRIISKALRKNPAERYQTARDLQDAGLPPEWRRVAPDQVFVDKPRWSPDGRLLYFIARSPGSRFNVWATRIAPATGTPIDAPFQITHFDRPDLLISPEVEQAEMSISATRLVLTMKKVTGSIWLLDGLGPAASATFANSR